MGGWLAPVAASLISAAGSALTNKQSADYAGNLNAQNRWWQEYMYNRYNSPAAMMRQYRDAGVNPYLGSSTDLVGSASSVPPQVMPTFSNPGESAAQGLAAGVQAAQVDSMVGNQRAEEFLKVTQGLSKVVQDYGVQGAQQYLSVVYPRLKNLGFDDFTINKLTDITVASAAAQRDILQIDSKWQKQYGFDFRSDLMMRNQQETSEVLGRIGLMSAQADTSRAQGDLFRQEIAESFSKIARNFAEAFKLEKEGNYYVASTETANQIRSYLVDQFILQNGLHGLQLLSGNLSYGVQSASYDIDKEMQQNPWLRYFSWGMDQIGKVIHVGAGFNWSNMQGTINSWSHSSAPAPVGVQGFAP